MSLPTLPPDAHRQPATVDDLTDLTDGWLRTRRLSAHTRSAYRRDVTHWLRWCAGRDIDPMAASFLHVNAYARELEPTVDGRTGPPTSAAPAATRPAGLGVRAGCPGCRAGTTSSPGSARWPPTRSPVPTGPGWTATTPPPS